MNDEYNQRPKDRLAEAKKQIRIVADHVTDSERVDKLKRTEAVLAEIEKTAFCEEADVTTDSTSTEVDILPTLKGEDSRALGYYGLQPTCSLGAKRPEV
jgi:hypothetical protein